MASDLSESLYARLINIAGRQRMLSQRVGLVLLMLTNKSDAGAPLDDDLMSLLRDAVRDFTHGYKILLKGDADMGLPSIESARVSHVLAGRQAPVDEAGSGSSLSSSGRATIDRFLRETDEIILGLESGRAGDERAMNAFSSFVLGPLLRTLQAIVEAMEADFEEEMRTRRSRRSAEVDLVMAAAGEIQKASRFSRMIALNAKISANRAGVHGQEFGALTEEIKKISANITQSSEEIIRHLDHV